MTNTLRRYTQIMQGRQGDYMAESPTGEWMKAADVERLMATHTDGYAGERTAWTLVPKGGEPIDLKLPVPLMRYILELDCLVGEQANTLKQRDAFVKEQRARIDQLEHALAAKEGACKGFQVIAEDESRRHIALAIKHTALIKELAAKEAEVEKLTAQLNTPEILDFAKAVNLEAAHQRERWGTDHDGGKEDADWFWLVGYLAGKALHIPEKRLHHLITAAAALANWHLYTLGKTNMRPGIESPKETP